MVEMGSSSCMFHLSGAVAVYPPVNGSGDSTLDYIHVLCMAAIAAVATLVWSILDRNRTEYRRLHAWLRIWVRYSLAFTLFSYGFAKVFPLQFQPAGLNRLMEPFHDFSPMGVLWSFMGASAAYTIFAGASEVLGGALLLFRRTTALGALVSAAVMLNVVMLNFCYDVPVKLYSMNLLLMALFLATPELGRLANAFLWNRPARRVEGGFSAVSQPMDIADRIHQCENAADRVHAVHARPGWDRKAFGLSTPMPARSPLYGIWEVEAGLSRRLRPTRRWRYCDSGSAARAVICPDDGRIAAVLHFDLRRTESAA